MDQFDGLLNFTLKIVDQIQADWLLRPDRERRKYP